MEWQPIETAPKDGTNIFLYENYAEVPFVGRWSIYRGWTANVQHLNTDGDATIVDFFDQRAITLWMPIMKMPEPS